MAVPGYEGIGRVGFSDKGDYSADKVYKAGDVVFSEGSSYLALKDNLQGVKPHNDGENWRFMARGFGAELLSGVMALDQSGLIGSTGASVNAQDLMNAIADKVATKLLLKTDVVNQIVNDANKAASAATLYSVKQTVDKVNSDVESATNNLSNKLDASKVAFAQDCKSIRFLIANKGGSNDSVAQIDFIINDSGDFYRFEITKSAYQFVGFINGEWT